MNLEYLDCFIIAVSCQSITKAADRMYLTQSTVSRRIAKLEEELGKKLIDRDAYSFQLTEAGKILYDEGQKIMHQVKLLKSKIDSIDQGMQDDFIVGCYGANALNIFALLKSYMDENYNNINLQSYQSTPPFMHDDMIKRNPDILISLACNLPDGMESGYLMKVLQSNKVVAVVSKNHYLAKKKRIRLCDLRKEKLIFWKVIVQAGVLENLQLSDECGTIPFNIEEEYNDLNDVFHAILMRNEVAILFDNFRRQLLPGMVMIPISDIDISVDLAYSYKIENSNTAMQACCSFLDSLRNI